MIFFIVFSSSCFAQNDSTGFVQKALDFPGRFLKKVNIKISGLDKQLDGQTGKYLNKLSREEYRLKRKMLRSDSSAAKGLFSIDVAAQYQLLEKKLKGDSISAMIPTGQYMPYADSLKMLLSFLNKNPDLVSSLKILPSDIGNSLNKLKQLQAKMQTADLITQFIAQRKEQIKNYLLKYTKIPAGIRSTYQDYSKQLYYYKEQVSSYRDQLDDPDKLLRTALTLLNKLPAFSAFVKKNSMLASLFPVNASFTTTGSVQGLSSRDQVTSFIQSGSNGTLSNPASMLQKNMQSAQGLVDQWRQKLNLTGGGDADLPEFKPNGQKTKSFLKRFEYGTNLQTVKSSYFFPTTTDLGLSIGYRLNDKNSVGIGASYKIGWGKDIKHIALSSEGIGLRSFADINIRKSFFASGGFEYNYQQPFYSPEVLRHLDAWQRSGLIGISKIVSLKTKLFTKTKIQLLWDFLSYQQVPRAQPFKFRVGYNF